MKKLLIKYLFLIILLVLYLILGKIFHIYIPCLFRLITHFYCPGCGITRMLYSILILDFNRAFHYNPLIFISLPFIIVLVINHIYCKVRNKLSIVNKMPDYVWYILIVILLIYGVLRNIYIPLQPID